MFNRKAEINLEKAYSRTPSISHHQFACDKACQALLKSIFVEMYQKQRIVIAIFNKSFNAWLENDFFGGGETVFINGSALSIFVENKGI
jgi:hypothetical protein